MTRKLDWRAIEAAAWKSKQASDAMRKEDGPPMIADALDNPPRSLV